MFLFTVKCTVRALMPVFSWPAWQAFEREGEGRETTREGGGRRLKLKLMSPVSNSNNEFRTEISSRFTNDIQ